MKKIIAIIGARPQFIKHAPIELASRGLVNLVTIHTGQHYDYKMSQIFFDELGIKKPDYQLNAGGGNHGEMTGRMMIEIEQIVIKENPDFVLVYGDTNSTLAGALVASKLNIPVVHIEAGLRSYNRNMPEEINRLLTDHVANYLFVPTESAIENLNKEGITRGVFKTGDVMCDMIRIAKERNIINESQSNFIYVTLHRPYNTDDLARLNSILEALDRLETQIQFYVHPRTQQKIKTGLSDKIYKNIQFKDPLSYFDNLTAMNQSIAIITDSGGIQKEAYILMKKCITIRSETEWIETLDGGWNTLVWEELGNIKDILSKPCINYKTALYGDGYASQEIW
ncbi:MAG: UDP-N-acetylglucosamine 2-epimerase (non-hydrolyzing), partial [Saprospiraceae bacterium]|nr:UDP-N-acetylglucosamine 2-epimerase (non-hydrolyzing) [Saprospiraceae bacterium]